MQLVPNVMAILEGMKAAKRLYAIIDHQSEIEINKNKDKSTEVHVSE